MSDTWKKIIDRMSLTHDAGFFISRMKECETLSVGFVNAHAMRLARKNHDFASNLCDCDIVLRDGIGVFLLLKLIGLAPGANLNGTDLIPKIIDAFPNEKVALLGSAPGVPEKVSETLAQTYPEMSFVVLDGFQDTEVYVRTVLTEQPRLVILGMGMPKQEAVAKALKEQSSFPVTIVCGGAILDFTAGIVVRAPKWMRKMGLEWLFRLVREPLRLFERYVIGIPMFFILALRYRLMHH